MLTPRIFIAQEGERALCLGVVLGGVSLRLQPPLRVDLFLYAHSTSPDHNQR